MDRLIDDDTFLDYWVWRGVDNLTFLPDELVVRICSFLGIYKNLMKRQLLLM